VSAPLTRSERQARNVGFNGMGEGLQSAQPLPSIQLCLFSCVYSAVTGELTTGQRP
jgi:hypothetical protein